MSNSGVGSITSALPELAACSIWVCASFEFETAKVAAKPEESLRKSRRFIERRQVWPDSNGKRERIAQLQVASKMTLPLVCSWNRDAPIGNQFHRKIGNS